METIIFTIKQVDKPPCEFYQKVFYIKHKRKKKAEIYQYSETSFGLYIGGLKWTKSSMKECTDYVIQNFESMLQALSKPATIKIKEL